MRERGNIRPAEPRELWPGPSRCYSVTIPFISSITSQTTDTLRPNKSETASPLIWVYRHTHTRIWVIAANMAAVILTCRKRKLLLWGPLHVRLTPTPSPSISGYFSNSLIHKWVSDSEKEKMNWALCHNFRVHWHMQHSGYCKHTTSIPQ